jgi:hypothetical protein
MIPMQAILDARQAQQRTGASDMAVALALSVAGPESSYNPLAVGDHGTSYGYTQLHTTGGLGDGHAVAELLDGPSNLAIAERYIQARLDERARPVDALQPWSTRDAGLAELADVQTQLGTVPTASNQVVTAADAVPLAVFGWSSLSGGQQIAAVAAAAALVALFVLSD